MSSLDPQELVRSPLNYMGGKYRILNQMLPLFSNKISTFYDLFGGGFNVGVNVKADKVVYNDIEARVSELFAYLYQTDTPGGLHNKFMFISEWYGLLCKDNPDGYLALRNSYNKEPSPDKLFVLIACSFSNQVRFNSSGKFNIPYGKRYYNPSLQSRMLKFLQALRSRPCLFYSQDFRCFDLNEFQPGDFVYCDPPYFGAAATYNTNGGWTDMDEQELLEFLDQLNDQNVHWALSNNLKLDNPLLHTWMDRYRVHYLDCDYSQCNYQKKDRTRDIEVLITNY